MATGPLDDLFVGVDGGGTRCRVRVRDGTGRVRAAAEGGRSNVYLDFDTALRTIRESVAEALALARDGGAARGRVRLGLGLAGVSGPAAAARVHGELEDLGEVRVTHDGDIACLGAHAGADGGLIIAGTGSAAFAHVGGVGTSIGGRGFIMGDDGSGARLGLDALRRALRAHDGLEPETPLTVALMGSFGDDPVAVIDWARSARSSEFGQFSPLVFSHAAQGDPVGLAVVSAAAAAVADLADALMRLGAARLSLVGGLAAPLRPFLPDRVTTALHEPLLDAQDGAMLLAGCPVPPAAGGNGA